jgi:cytochrome c oxidase assembly factor CtaG
MSQWVIPILTNIIAAVLIFLAKPIGSFGKRIFTKGRVRLKARTKLNAKTTTAFIKYTVFVGIGLIPIGYNSWWLYKFTKGSPPATRSDVLVIFFYAALIVYWLWNMVSKIRNYSVKDYLDDDA